MTSLADATLAFHAQSIVDGLPTSPKIMKAIAKRFLELLLPYATHRQIAALIRDGKLATHAQSIVGGHPPASDVVMQAIAWRLLELLPHAPHAPNRPPVSTGWRVAELVAYPFPIETAYGIELDAQLRKWEGGKRGRKPTRGAIKQAYFRWKKDHPPKE